MANIGKFLIRELILTLTLLIILITAHATTEHQHGMLLACHTTRLFLIFVASEYLYMKVNIKCMVHYQQHFLAKCCHGHELDYCTNLVTYFQMMTEMVQAQVTNFVFLKRIFAFFHFFILF